MAVPQTLGPRVAQHLLNRAGYGPRPGQIAAVLDQGLTEWIEDQLDPGADPELDTRLRGFTTLGYSTSQVLSLYNADNRTIGVILDEFSSAKVVRAVHARNQLQEVLVDFWFNHFNVFVGDGFDRYSIPSYERDAIRPHVLGRFRDLLGAVAAPPGDALLPRQLPEHRAAHAGRAADRRHQRELRPRAARAAHGRRRRRLHADRRGRRRALPHGLRHRQRRASGNFVFRAGEPRPGRQAGVRALAWPAAGAQEDVERLLDYLAVAPGTARFISRRLAQRFVADDPPEALVARVADVFLRTGGDLREVVKALVGQRRSSGPRRSPAASPRPPLEYVVSTLRAAGAELTNTRVSRTAISDMGMPLYACNPPTGYSNRGGDWLNPSAQLYRMNFALDLRRGRGGRAWQVDIRGLIRAAAAIPASPASAAEAI